MKRALCILILSATIVACKNRTPTITVDASSPAPAETVVVAPVDATAPPPPRASAEIRDAKPPENAPHVGDVHAWSEEDGDFSLVLIAEGKKPTHLVRRTSGSVNDLQLVKMEDGDYAVAWVSALVGGKGQVSAVSFVSADLVKASAPVTLALLEKESLEGHIAMVKNPKGGVLVAYEGAGAENGVTFEVKAVSAAGKADKLGTKKIAGGPSPALWIVDLEDRGALVYGSSMAGGNTIGTLVVPWTAGEPAPAFSPPICFGLAAIESESLRGTNGEVVSLCIDARYGEKLDHCVKPLKDDPERCLRVAVTAKDGTPVTPAKDWNTPVSKVECTGKNVQLSFPTGTGPARTVTLASRSEHVADWLKKTCE